MFLPCLRKKKRIETAAGEMTYKYFIIRGETFLSWITGCFTYSTRVYRALTVCQALFKVHINGQSRGLCPRGAFVLVGDCTIEGIRRW